MYRFTEADIGLGQLVTSGFGDIEETEFFCYFFAKGDPDSTNVREAFFCFRLSTVP